MENISQHLETECFSYRWLATEQQQQQQNDDNNEEEDQSWNFDFEITSTMSLSPLADADKLFSNGVIKPHYLPPTTTTTTTTTATISPLSSLSSSSSSCIPSTSLAVNNAGEFDELQRTFPRKKILWKYLMRCFNPVCKSTTRGGRTRVDDVNRRTIEVRSSSSSSSSSRASPRVRRQSCAWSSDESSIHEAILYCKQSNAL
ncbi:hypothetical protein vseg_004423 [Gypsophila vaccaria]